MRFTDFLRVSVLLFAGGATALATAAIGGATAAGNHVLLAVSVSWWIIAAVLGLWLGRRPEASEGIRRMLTAARSTPTLPEVEPGRTVVNRMWPLALFLAVAGGIAFLLPQVPAIGAGYAEIMALAWRKQARAVAAIEDRDGVRFYVERSSPWKPTQLVRTPWMRRIEPIDDRVGATLK
ncbi:MAG: hypothetical protein ACJ76Z_12420 [Thermoleophilaceae bacterium]